MQGSAKDASAEQSKAQQERSWIERLMAGAPTGADECLRLARAIVHPWCYRRAGGGEPYGKWDDPGWRALYRIMVMVIEEWCREHPKKARWAAKRMKFDGMLWLSYKEKWGLMRWEVHGGEGLPRSLHRTIGRMEWILEAASAAMCMRCGRESEVRKPVEEKDGRWTHGWVNGVCDDCHRTHAHEERERDEARWNRRHIETGARQDEPPSEAETDAGLQRYLALLCHDHSGHDHWAYAGDVLKEWQAREDEARGQGTQSRPQTHCGVANNPPPVQAKPHQVRLGRWRYEEAEVCVNAKDAEDAAARAPNTSPEWSVGTEVSDAFVREVGSDEKISLRTRLRIEEHHGKTAALQAALETCRKTAREQAGKAR